MSKNTTGYEERIVGYIDILGYQNLISTTGLGLAMALINKIKGVPRLLQPVPGFDISEFDILIKFFSDTITVSMPFKKDAAFFALSVLAGIQVKLALERLFVRGAVSSGFHYEDDNVIVSPTLIKAYSLTNSISVYPRIIVDPDFLEMLAAKPWPGVSKAISGNGVSFVTRLCDGVMFVDYLNWYRIAIKKWELILSFYKIHKEAIEKAIRDNIDNPKILAKYFWLSEYHNRTIRDLPTGEDISDWLIKLEEVAGSHYPVLNNPDN